MPRDTWELEGILERKAREIMMRRRSTCCIKDYGGRVVEIRAPGDIERILSDCRVALINFYSTMCPYCEAFDPVYSRAARRYGGRAVFARADAGALPEAAYAFNIMATPTTIAFIDGRPETIIPGYIPYDMLVEVIERILRKAGC